MQYDDIGKILNIDINKIKEVLENKNSYYYSFPIRKKNGKKRYIDAPFGILKQWQEIVTKELFYNFGPHPIAYGFAKNKNPLMAATIHTNKDILVAMDVKNFFNSIRTENLIDLFRYLQFLGKLWTVSNKYPTYTSRNFAQTGLLIELLTFKDMVPQGAPSSPALSNIYMLRADKLLNQLAIKHDASISRYADDIVFSKNNPSKEFVLEIITGTKAILQKYKLRLNSEKIHINRKNKRMRVVGIVVNKKTNIPRETWRNFRAQLHNLKINKTPIGPKQAQILRGKIEWYKTVNCLRGNQFLQEFGQLNFLNTSSILIPTKI